MKNANKNKNWLLIAICVLCAVLIAAVVLLFLLSRGATNKPIEKIENNIEETEEASTPTDAIEQGEEIDVIVQSVYDPIDDFEVDLYYYAITFSGQWGNNLKVDASDKSAKFIALIDGEEVPVFDINYNADAKTHCYLMDSNGELVSVSIAVHDVTESESWTEEDKVAVYGMQNQIDRVLSQIENATQNEFAYPDEELTIQPTTSSTNENDTTVVGEDVHINTPYGTLTYPGKWAQYLRTEIKTGNGCTVSFFCGLPGKESVYMFDITIGVEGEDYIGMYTADDGKTYELYVTSFEFAPDTTWGDEEINIVFGMMDGVSDILTTLETEGRLVC